MSQLLLTTATELDIRREETDTRDREDDPTPRLLVRAILSEAMPVIMRELGDSDRGWDLDLDALDVCAGYGCWSSELRRWCVRQGLEVMLTGVEIFEARREHLRKWCDNVVIDDWRASYGLTHDIVVGNPHFSALAGGDPDESMPAVLLRRAPSVLLYHTRNAFVRSEAGRAVWRAYPPAHVFVVPGTVSHDGTSAVASDCYQVSLWLRGHTGPTTEQLLDVEPKAENLAAGIVKRNGEPYSCWRWTVPPGSEEPCEDLPGVVGWGR